MQQTLLGEKKQEEKKEIPKPDKNTPSNVFVEEFEAIEKDETFAVAQIVRKVVSTLGERITTLLVSDGLSIEPYPQENSCYGGYWGLQDYSEEQAPELLRDLIEFRKHVLELPYTDDLRNADRYTNLKDSNIFIQITQPTKKLIEEKANIKWDKFLEDFNSIKSKHVPSSYGILVREEHKLEKEIEAKQKEVSDLKENYVKQIEEDSPNLDNFGKKPGEIYDTWKKAKSHLAELEAKLKGVRVKIDNAAS